MKIIILGGLLCLAGGAALSQVDGGDEKDLEEMRSVLNELDESFSEYRGYVDVLRKIRISGYLQPQYRIASLEGAIAPYSGGSFPQNVDNEFELKRGRVKIHYQDQLTSFVFQIDGRQSGVIVKDAYGAIIDPWVKSFGFQMGIFDRPFGYENALSSGSRETPERARVIQTLMPGERELGAKLFYAPKFGPLSFLRFDLAAVNGAGPLSSEFDNLKDFIMRASANIPLGESATELDLGISGQFGNIRNGTKYIWSVGTVSPGVKNFVLDSSATNMDAGVSRHYLGGDAQLYCTIPGLGATALRGEVITGTQPGGSKAASPPDPFGTDLSTGSPTSQPTGPIYTRDFLGWYINLVQNIGESFQVIARYDVYDPNIDISGKDFSASTNLSPADIRFNTFGLGFIHYWDEHVKFVFYYEWISNEKLNPSAAVNSSLAPFVEDLKDNILTLRMQVKF